MLVKLTPDRPNLLTYLQTLQEARATAGLNGTASGHPKQEIVPAIVLKSDWKYRK